MTVHLIDKNSFSMVSKLGWSELYNQAQNGTLRKLRPQLDNELTRLHDIDSEVELLEWMDKYFLEDIEKDFISTICHGINSGKLNFEQGCDGLYHLIELCCTGYWQVWEARSYLYFEKILGITVGNIEELYAEEVWNKLIKKINEISAKEFTEIVVMDWMRRREELGETLDETKDPRILPTMTSHSKSTSTLHHLLRNCNDNDDFEIIVGRDHLKKSQWGHGEWNIGNIIRRNENFK
ncbi:MAG: hypothetical protein VYE59_04620 [Candidatus Thermoplasmatota archaeon]|nr:hypothetical protein [Candidatus Thermoplasmatota archaeon]